MDYSTMFGERLQLSRRRCGLRQYQLASETGVAQRTLTRWENGDVRGANFDALVAVADRLGVSIDWLLGRELNEQYPKSVVSDRIVHSIERNSE